MNLTFLAPLFLAGIAAIAIPIIVHLTHRERRDAVPFPSLMFLRKVPFRTVKRQKIRHWLLFLVRVAAILLLVAAFARPLLDSAALGSATIGTTREVVILLDRSYSMAYGDRWDRAIDAARSTVGALEPDDRATIVFFSDRAEAANLGSADRIALNAILDEAQPSSQRTQYGPALQLAHDILVTSELPRRELVLITDFQRVGWEGQRDLRLPEGTVLRPVDLSESDPANVAVAGVLLSRTGNADRRQVAVSARIANTGVAPVSGAALVLELDGQSIQERTVDLDATSSTTANFDAVAVPDRLTRARVRIQGDALPHDDMFHFTIAPVQAVPLLVLHNPGARASELIYLRQALGIGFDPPFDVEVKPVTQMEISDLDGRAMVVLDDASYPRGAAGRALTQFVRDGGGLFVILGSRSGQAVWTTEVGDSLGTVGTPVDRSSGRGATVSILDFSHALFEPFSAPRSGDFSTPRFFRYRRYDPPAGATVLARYDDGAAALAEVRLGLGRVIVLTSGLANVWNDFPVHPVFLPFVHRAALHLATYRPEPASYAAGQFVDLDAHPGIQPWGVSDRAAAQYELIVETPSGDRFSMDPGEERHLELREHGFYVARSLDGASVAPRIIAVNPDVAESDLTPLDPEELISAVEPPEGGGARAAALAASLTPNQKERRQGLWWYLLAGALLLLMGEAVLAGRLSRPARRKPTAGSRNADTA
jgi:hypothetical protein